MTDADAVYRKLQRHLDKMPVPFPATESGVEIRVLKHLFTPEEAEIALGLSALPEPVERIHRRLKHTGISKGALQKTLDGLVAKGAIMGNGEPGGRRYSKAQFAIGMYEFQVDQLTKDFQKDARQYLEEAFGGVFHSEKTSQMRTVPINESVTPERHVATYDSVRALVESSEGPFAVLNCVCRQGMDLLDQPCRQTDIRRTCLALKSMAQACIESGVGQPTTREGMLQLLDRADEAGMVLQPENAQDSFFICCCCGCCCGVLTSAKRFPRPAERFHTNYRAIVDPELCTACETCADRCQMDAVRLVDDATRVDLDRCIGCGLCVSTCPSHAMALEKKEKESVPPKTHRALYQQILTERFGRLGTLKMAGKALLGMKI